MEKAKKLPSGSWRARVYSHTTPDGKRHYESFIASTKEQANMMAASFENTKKRKATCDLTVKEAVNGYITAKTNVLSPSTIRSYKNMAEKYFDRFGNAKIKKLTSEDAQLFISDLTAKHSAKTVKNIYALFTASVGFYAPDITFKVSLPTTIKKTAAAPSNEQIMELMGLASDWMKNCIALSAFGSLRRGEIASLKYGDLKGNTLFIHSDMVMDENNKWIYKEIPKNQASVRYAKIPQTVVDLLGTGMPDEYIIKYNPNTISKMFIKLRQRVGIDVRFHDLRHYYASIGAALNIPDIYVADFAGWRHGSNVMKSVYQGNISSIADGYSKQMNDYFEDIIKKSMS